MNLDQLTLVEEQDIFSLKQFAARPAEDDPNVIHRIRIEMDLAQTTVRRTHYTGLQMIADVGGFSSAIFLIATIVTSLINYKHIDSYLAA